MSTPSTFFCKLLHLTAVRCVCVCMCVCVCVIACVCVCVTLCVCVCACVWCRLCLLGTLSLDQLVISIVVQILCRCCFFQLYCPSLNAVFLFFCTEYRILVYTRGLRFISIALLFIIIIRSVWVFDQYMKYCFTYPMCSRVIQLYIFVEENQALKKTFIVSFSFKLKLASLTFFSLCLCLFLLMFFVSCLKKKKSSVCTLSVF